MKLPKPKTDRHLHARRNREVRTRVLQHLATLNHLDRTNKTLYYASVAKELGVSMNTATKVVTGHVSKGYGNPSVLFRPVTLDKFEAYLKTQGEKGGNE